MRTQLLSCLMIVMLVLTITGCTQNTQTPVTSKETVQAMLAKAVNISSMYYEINGTLPLNANDSTNGTSPQSQFMTIKVWNKKPYLKEIIKITTFGVPTELRIIQRPEGTYVYNPFTNEWNLTTNLPQYATFLKYIDPAMIKDLLNNQTITHFPTQVIDGKQATLVNLSVGLLNNQSIAISVWIWNDKGVPLKAIIAMNLEVKLRLVLRFNNYLFQDIANSVFNVS